MARYRQILGFISEGKGASYLLNADNSSVSPRMIWVYTGALNVDLDASTWLETTRQLRDLGCQVTLIHAGPHDLGSIQGVEVVSIPKSELYLIRQAVFHIRVLRLILSNWRTTDVVFFHQMSLPWLFPWRYPRIAARQTRPLFIMDTRTAPMIPKEFASIRDRVRTIFDNTMNRLANRVTDGQTAITQRMATSMHIPGKQLLGVWPSGVDVQEFEVTRQIRNWEDVDRNVHIIYIGAMHYQRNLMNFCQAIELENTEYPRFTFTMVGQGTEFEDLKKFAEQTEDRIRVLPPVAHEEVPALLAEAHVGVLPFPDHERFRVSSPIKLFEYMASGMPILATHIDCHTDVVENGEFAFWAYDESVEGLLAALESVWEQRHFLQQKGQEAASAAPDWSWTASTEKLYRAILNGLDISDGLEVQTGMKRKGA